ncbi:hypothetical protein FJY68_04995 [candidate division WOR-3 bacterium]|uniref:DUF4175 family protein n=1 Tax=candidate division WOR-3 bacterium TaxID=2052148 RepID=A0A937XHK1_UNCW3|nr:hypothetical protein [candidate division WOR-3 bacterium]
MRRGEVIECRLRALVGERVAWDLLALAVFTLAMTGALLMLVVSLFWSGWVMAALAVPVGLLVRRLVAENRFWNVARLVEERFSEVRGKLVAGMQLARWGRQEFRAQSPESRIQNAKVLGREGYSEEMIEAAVADVEKVFAPLPLGQFVDRRRALWAGVALVAMAVCMAALFRAAPARMRVGLSNAFSSGAEGITFEVSPGDTAVMPGGSVVLRARVFPAGVFREVRLIRSGSESDTRDLRVESDTCRVVLAAGHGFAYRFRVLSRSSDPHRVRVLEPLTLERLVFTLRPPAYSGLQETRMSGVGRGAEVSGLKGTVVGIEGEANRPAAAGRLRLGDDTIAVTVDARDSSLFRAEFTIRGDVAGAIELADFDYGVLQPAAEVRVRAIADEPPFVKLFAPGRDIDLPVSMQVLLGINSLDDFGLGDLVLHYGKELGRGEEGGESRVQNPESRVQSLVLKRLAGRREDTTLYAWDLSDAGLLPGEAMWYYVSVTDNDGVSGSKVSRTEVFQVRFPTMTEIYNAAVRQTERTESELGPMQSEQAQLGEELSRLSDEMKKSRELSWEEKQALEKVLGGQEGLMQQVSDLKQEVSDMMKELSQGMTLDQQTMERMNQLQQLLSELLPRELQQSLAQLRDKLEQQSPDVKRALEKFELDQEKMKEAIDRALELLKKIMEEQRLEALAKKSEELARAQEDLTDRLGKEPGESSAQMEQNLKEALDSLQQEMKDLADSMSEKEIGDSLSDLAEQAEQDKLSETAQELANQMRQGSPGQAKPKSGKLGQSLRKMSQSLNSLSRKLKSKRSSEVAQELGNAARDLLMVSHEQEKLEQATMGMADLAQNAAQEMGLQAATRIVAESVASLSSRSLSVDPRLGQELAKTMAMMEQAAQGMVENRSEIAQPSMAQARQGLNQTVEALLRAMAQAQQGGGMSSGMEGLMQQLSQMTGEQMGINAGMSGFPIPMPGGLSGEQMAALSRVLGKQRALREQLQQLLQELGGTQPGLTSSLEGLLDEMKAVERDLSELNVSRELIERQESILSHLLDAERSIRQQGFKEERQSESGKEFELQPRPRLPEDKGERNRLLREELMRALKQGYPAEYEQMIREYFQRLLSE